METNEGGGRVTRGLEGEDKLGTRKFSSRFKSNKCVGLNGSTNTCIFWNFPLFKRLFFFNQHFIQISIFQAWSTKKNIFGQNQDSQKNSILK